MYQLSFEFFLPHFPHAEFLLFFYWFIFYQSFLLLNCHSWKAFLYTEIKDGFTGFVLYFKFAFRVLMHLLFIFVCNMKSGFNFIFFPFIKKLVLVLVIWDAISSYTKYPYAIRPISELLLFTLFLSVHEQVQCS